MKHQPGQTAPLPPVVAEVNGVVTSAEQLAVNVNQRVEAIADLAPKGFDLGYAKLTIDRMESAINGPDEPPIMLSLVYPGGDNDGTKPGLSFVVSRQRHGDGDLTWSIFEDFRTGKEGAEAAPKSYAAMHGSRDQAVVEGRAYEYMSGKDSEEHLRAAAVSADGVLSLFEAVAEYGVAIGAPSVALIISEQHSERAKEQALAPPADVQMTDEVPGVRLVVSNREVEPSGGPTGNLVLVPPVRPPGEKQ